MDCIETVKDSKGGNLFMSDLDNYWKRKLAHQGISRRRVLGGALAGGVGVGSLALVGCGDDDDDGDGDATQPPTGGTTAPGASATAPAAAITKGGTARFSSANNTWDTFDVDRSRFTPFAVVMGFTNEGIVHYKSFEKGELEGALAQSWEQPDASTLNIKLRPNKFWHNKNPVNGRAVTADDLVQFINRNKNGKTQDGVDDVNFYRKGEYANVASVSSPDATTVNIKFTKPDPFFLGTLASGYAKVQAPEAVKAFEKDYANLRADLIIGTGGYVLTEFKAEGNLTFEKFDKYPQGVNIDKIQYFPLFTDNAALQAAFEQKQIDSFGPRTKQVLDELLSKYKDKITNYPSFAANPMAGTYYGGTAPWNNANLIGAIFRTIDRRKLIQDMFQGLAALAGNIPPTQSAFSITEKELITYPGYLEDRNKELTEAKAMWAAGGGPALGDITVDIPDIWEGAYSGVGALITQQMLKANLGNNFNVKLEPYSTITGKLIKQQYGNGANNIWYGWISDVTKLEPSIDLYNSYNSASPQFQQFGVKIQKVDDTTTKLLTELDVEKRKVMTKEVMVELIKAYGAGIPYNMITIGNTLAHNYYHPTENQPFVTAHQFPARAYIDTKDPTYQGRPA
jgi:peptide/nickel transport system substrate-binding protein